MDDFKFARVFSGNIPLSASYFASYFGPHDMYFSKFSKYEIYIPKFEVYNIKHVLALSYFLLKISRNISGTA